MSNEPRLYGNDDIDAASLKSERIAILGYGSQGRAHALNLSDSGAHVVVGLRNGSASEARARADGLATAPLEEAVAGASLIAVLTPDMSHDRLYADVIAPNIADRAALLFAHGFSIHYGRVKAPQGRDVILVAPKGPGDLVRREYVQGRGVPCLFAVHQDATGKARERAMAYARGLGGATGGLIATSFAEETETDLFGEQAVLCGGVTELIVAGFETLVEAGYQPEVAYFECLHELKLIVDLIHEGGLAKMHKFVSDTAKYGDLLCGPKVVNGETRARMRELLSSIRSGAFARDWILENQAGRTQYDALLAKDLSHPIEAVGQALRERMHWLKPPSNAI